MLADSPPTGHPDTLKRQVRGVWGGGREERLRSDLAIPHLPARGGFVVNLAIALAGASDDWKVTT
jgi:hypothetical protein